MALIDRVPELIEYIEDHKGYLHHNQDLFDIFEGNLLPHIVEDMRKTVSPEYWERIKHRVIPINVLKRIIDKLSKVYANDPVRTTQNPTDQELVDFYEKEMDFNSQMNHADEFSNLFKGYFAEPYIDEDEEGPRLRILPYDRFLVKSDSVVNPLRSDVLMKIMQDEKTVEGERRVLVFAYDNESFVAFDTSGAIRLEFMQENEGVNPFGTIPGLYGNRSLYSLLPKQDTDTLPLTKAIPLFFTDLSGMLLFQAFSIVYAVDVDVENMKVMPNAFWSFKSDPESDKQPQVDTIKPEADSDKILSVIQATFSSWLETRGIKSGSIGQLSTSDFTSGISKIIDEMDTSEIRKVAIQFFKKEERKLWKVIKTMHNKWVEMGQLSSQPMFSDDFEISVEFDDPRPIVSRKEEVETKSIEVDKGFLDQRSAIEQLYPDMSPEQVDERMELVAMQAQFNITVDNGTEGTPTENDDQIEQA